MHTKHTREPPNIVFHPFYLSLGAVTLSSDNTLKDNRTLWGGSGGAVQVMAEACGILKRIGDQLCPAQLRPVAYAMRKVYLSLKKCTLIQLRVSPNWIFAPKQPHVCTFIQAGFCLT